MSTTAIYSSIPGSLKVSLVIVLEGRHVIYYCELFEQFRNNASARKAQISSGWNAL